MSINLVHYLYAGFAPWFALSLLFLILFGRKGPLSPKRTFGTLLLTFLILWIPVMGWPLFRWIAVLEPNPSFLLTALLGIALWEKIGTRKLFRPCDWRMAWIFGALAALALYPTGLGLTLWDANSWGWRSPLPLVILLIATILLLRGNRFGILLLAPFLGFLLNLQESRNFWEAILDPFYGGFALIALAASSLRKRSQA